MGVPQTCGVITLLGLLLLEMLEPGVLEPGLLVLELKVLPVLGVLLLVLGLLLLEMLEPGLLVLGVLVLALVGVLEPYTPSTPSLPQVPPSGSLGHFDLCPRLVPAEAFCVARCTPAVPAWSL